MLLPVDHVSEERFHEGLRSLIGDGIFAQAVSSLTGGVLLVGYGMSLGASNLVIGLLAAAPFLSHLLQIPTIHLVEKFRRRRALAVICVTASRACLIPLAFLPFLENRDLAQLLLVAGVAVNSGLGAMAGCSWNSWVHDLIPARMLGSFFARRLSYGMGSAMASGIAAGFVIDWWGRASGQPAYAYSVLFLLAAVAGAVSTWFVARVPEPRMARAEPTVRLAALISEPFRDANFRRLIWFLGSWQFATNLASPFFAVYLVQRLGCDMTFATLMNVVSQCANMLVLGFWGRLSDRFGNKAVLGICGPLFLACVFAWTLIPDPGRHSYAVALLTVLHVLMGCMVAGVNLALGNIGLKLAPRGRATAYLAAGNIVNSLAAGIAPVLVGVFADDLATRTVSLSLRLDSGPDSAEFLVFSLHSWDFFFLLSGLWGVYSLRLLRLVKEEGGLDARGALQRVILETRRAVLSLGSAAGFRVMTSVAPERADGKRAIGREVYCGIRREAVPRS